MGAANELAEAGLHVSSSGVRSVWVRNEMGSMKFRLRALSAKVAQDTYYVGSIKGVGRIFYQQTFFDTYSRVAFAKVYDRRNALVAAGLLNDRVIPFFEEQDVRLLRILTGRGTEYCGALERHEYQLYLAVEGIDHTRTRVKRPRSNSICERFH